jgi:hypothetical protein
MEAFQFLAEDERIRMAEGEGQVGAQFPLLR